MKRPAFMILFATVTACAMAQTKLPAPPALYGQVQPFKIDTTLRSPLLKDLTQLPKTNMQALPKSLYNAKTLAALPLTNDVIAYASVDKMPVAKMAGRSNMPVIKPSGNYTMPVAGKKPESSSDVVTIERP